MSAEAEAGCGMPWRAVALRLSCVSRSLYLFARSTMPMLCLLSCIRTVRVIVRHRSGFDVLSQGYASKMTRARLRLLKHSVVYLTPRLTKTIRTRSRVSSCALAGESEVGVVQRGRRLQSRIINEVLSVVLSKQVWMYGVEGVPRGS